MRQILFIQGGGGTDVHDTWDDKLVDSLTSALGDGYEVRYPRMPDEDDPSYARWQPAIARQVDALDHGAVVVGHSIGGTMLINALAELFSCEGRSPDSSSRTGPLPAQGNKDNKLSAIILLSAPF